MAKFAGFVGGAYQQDSLPIDTQRCINWYPEVPGSADASTLKSLRPTPGYKEWVNFTGFAGVYEGAFVRGLYRTTKGLGTVLPDPNGSVICVVGTGVWWIKSKTENQLLGEVSALVTEVYMMDDGNGLMIADGVHLYRCDLTTLEFLQVNYSLNSPTHLAYQGGRTIAMGNIDGTPSNAFFWSEIDDNKTWDALSYASAESSADSINGILVNGSYLWLFGPNSYEVWSPTNDINLPWQRTFAAAGTIGLRAPRSLLSVGGKVVFIGSTTQGSPVAYMSTGGTDFVKISTPALDREWALTSVDDCTTFGYSDKGHTFVVFNFDTLDKTYVYDITDGQGGEWHQRASRDPNTNLLHRWAPQFCTQYNGLTLMGDRNTPRLYEVSESLLTENGVMIQRIRTTPHVHAAQHLMRCQSVTFDMETGTGISTQDAINPLTGHNRQYEAPTVMLRYSWDYGRTYSSELRQTFGRMGEYKSVLQFRKLGQGRDFVVEFKLTDPCATTVTNGWVDMEEGQQRT